MVRLIVLAALCAAAALAYISRGAIAVPADAIGTELGLSERQLGWAMGAFFVSYALFQIPGGWLGCTIGTRRALTLYVVAWSAATAALGLAGSLWTLIALRLAMGAAQAGLFPCSVDAISRWFPATRRAVACGSLGALMGVGGAAATAITGALLTWYVWRQVFFVVAFPGIAFALWFAWWFRDRPEEHPAVSREELAVIRGGAKEAPGDAGPDVDRKDADGETRRRIAPAALVLVCGQQFFRAMVAAFYITWFPKFLTERYGVSVAESGLLSSLPLLAQVGGSLAGGAIADAVLARTGSLRLSRQGVATVGLLACAGSFVAAYFVPTAGGAVAIITAGNLLATLAGPCAYAVTIDLGGRSTPIVFGAMNMTGNLGAAVFPVSLAEVAERAGWDPVLFVLAGLSVAAAACWLLLDPGPPTAPRRQRTSGGSVS